MPKFYFHIRDDAGLIPDEEGMELPDIDAARKEAETGAREILADALRAHKEVDGKRIEIANQSGEVLDSFKVRDLLN
jgi:hypothetical protein